MKPWLRPLLARFAPARYAARSYGQRLTLRPMKRLLRPVAASFAAPLALGLALALPACQRPEAVPAPADLLPREKVVNLLIELHLLEARVENTRLTPDSARALFLAQQKNLLWQASVGDSAFQHSYRYYSIHGKDLDEMYQAIVDSLERRKLRLTKK